MYAHTYAYAFAALILLLPMPGAHCERAKGERDVNVLYGVVIFPNRSKYTNVASDWVSDSATDVTTLLHRNKTGKRTVAKQEDNRNK